MNKKQEEKIGKLVSQLDKAVGMLIVAAMKDPVVREAMEKVSKVSFDLGNMV